MNFALFVGSFRAVGYLFSNGLILQQLLVNDYAECSYMQSLFVRLSVLLCFVVGYAYRTHLLVLMASATLAVCVYGFLLLVVLRCGMYRKLIVGGITVSQSTSAQFGSDTVCGPYLRRCLLATLFMCMSTFQVAPNVGTPYGTDLCEDRAFVLVYEIHAVALAFGFIWPHEADPLMQCTRPLWSGVSVTTMLAAVAHGFTNGCLQYVYCGLQQDTVLSVKLLLFVFGCLEVVSFCISLFALGLLQKFDWLRIIRLFCTHSSREINHNVVLQHDRPSDTISDEQYDLRDTYNNRTPANMNLLLLGGRRE